MRRRTECMGSNEKRRSSAGSPGTADFDVRNYAASALRGKQRRFHLKYIWMPAAAALFICFGIAYTALPGLPQAKVATPVNLTETYSGMDTLDSDLLALTSQLEQTSDKLLSMTVLSSIMETAQKNGGSI